MDRDFLIKFEEDIIKEYEAGHIRGPVHLSGGNEDELLWIFKHIKTNDWVFSTHRSHYHALLKSNDAKWVKQEILDANSIHINSDKHKIFTSAIVGGILPIALGTAMGIKLRGGKEKVWVFVGDMCSEMGVFWECVKLMQGKGLPIFFIVEDNQLGVTTPTLDVWGQRTKIDDPQVIYYDYIRKYPHHGITGKDGKPVWVDFDAIDKKKGGEPHNMATF